MDLILVSQAISETKEGLDAAGYDLDCEEQSERLVLRVRARADACADCLTPKHVMATIVLGELEEKGIRVGGIDIVYPNDK